MWSVPALQCGIASIGYTGATSIGFTCAVNIGYTGATSIGSTCAANIGYTGATSIGSVLLVLDILMLLVLALCC